ncbi:hypothetical protein MLD38_005415 [Melastoma candidum]|uniref:Uncharacterized protein n=1 Tax=Melastoma candidum TaxID=119954 RepID=A0ACB9RLI6_9MYRT|nr:hypothetical protein MLD38_005415 [Melastoma candidum]
MAIEKKVETEVEIKSSADKFFKRLSTEIHHTRDASSEKVHSIEVHEGNWETPGSVKLWSYTINGKKETFKEKIEVDEEKKIVTMVAMDGHVLERYGSYKICFETIPRGEAAVVKMTITVLKPHEETEDPHDYLMWATEVIKDIDTHLVAQV